MFVIPTLTWDEIASFYSLIRVSLLGVAAPIHCIANEVSRDWEAPQHPLESATFVTDTIYELPKTVSYSGYVEADMLAVFEAMIKLTTTIGYGFTIYTMGGVYSNMFVTNFTRRETADVSTGYKFDITFQEAKQIGLLNNAINLAINAGSSLVASAINCINQGSILPLADGGLEILDSSVQFGLSL